MQQCMDTVSLRGLRQELQQCLWSLGQSATTTPTTDTLKQAQRPNQEENVVDLNMSGEEVLLSCFVIRLKKCRRPWMRRNLTRQSDCVAGTLHLFCFDVIK